MKMWMWVLFLLAAAMAAQAQYAYTTNNNTIAITKYAGPGGVVTIPSTINSLPVASIGGAAFLGCTNLTNVTIPDSVTSIEDAAFFGCHNLASVTIPDNVASIKGTAFAYCSSLASVAIPNSVTSIGDFAFSFCASLAAFTVDALHPVYRSVDGVLFDKRLSTLIKCPAGKSGAYEIPDNITKIGDSAFLTCAKLTSITIPASVTSIRPSAFGGCAGLTGVYFKGNATPFAMSVGLKDSPATVYYLPGTEGWGATFCDRPTAEWVHVGLKDSPATVYSVRLPGMRNWGATFFGRDPTITTEWVRGCDARSIAQYWLVMEFNWLVNFESKTKRLLGYRDARMFGYGMIAPLGGDLRVDPEDSNKMTLVRNLWLTGFDEHEKRKTMAYVCTLQMLKNGRQWRMESVKFEETGPVTWITQFVRWAVPSALLFALVWFNVVFFKDPRIALINTRIIGPFFAGLFCVFTFASPWIVFLGIGVSLVTMVNFARLDLTRPDWERTA